MRILVTGGAGFIASHLVCRLVEHGHNVTVLDNLSHGNKFYVPEKAHFVELDLLDPKVDTVFHDFKPQIVFHHAAQIDVTASQLHPLIDARTNILGTLAILIHARNHNVQKIIYASSAAVYGTPQYLPINELHPIQPVTFYGISKHTPEHYIETFSALYGLDYTILRYANVYGPRQDPTGEGGVIAIFLDKLMKGEAPVVYGDGLQTRDFIFVQDVVNANIAALSKGSKLILNISSNQATTIRELLNQLELLSKEKISPVYLSPRLGDVLHSVLSNEAALTALNWSPQYTIEEGLKASLDYLLRDQKI